MKLLPILFFTAASFAGAFSDVVTLTASNPSVDVEPTDIVQVVSALGGSDSNHKFVVFSMAGGGRAPLLRLNGSGFGAVVMTGVARVTLALQADPLIPLAETDPTAATLRITKRGQEFFSEPVILPAVTDEDYTVELQTSTDLVNWIPAVPGDYLGGAANRFFRVKVEAKRE